MARINDASAEMHNLAQRFEACPEFKAFLWRGLLSDVEAQRRTSVSYWLEHARKVDWARSDGDPFRVNNNLAPAIARLFLAEHPEAAPFIRMRRAACDGMPFPGGDEDV